MKKLIFILLILTACSKEEPGYFVLTHPKGLRTCNMTPVPNVKTGLKYRIRFTESCLYPELPNSSITGLNETASWNKLIYIGAVDPHFKAANFGWRHYQDRLQLAARVYDNDTGDALNHVVLWETDIDIDTWYELENSNHNGRHYWIFNGRKVAEYDETVPNDWLSAPYFGGGDGLPWQGNVPNQDITFHIQIL